jgi:trimethylamine--corrinoid protein Co-methyltransferase
VPDSQAAHEKTITSLLPAMAGANTIYGSGMLELGVTFSMEQLVIDNDIIAMEKKAMEGVLITGETLAADAIKEIGVGNDFLAHPSTMNNIELASDPMIFDRYMIGDWRAAGCKSAVDVAHDIVEDVMKNHVVKPIPADILDAMKVIVKKADDEFKKSRE